LCGAQFWLVCELSKIARAVAIGNRSVICVADFTASAAVIKLRALVIFRIFF
jgi:hypothetical protein